MANLCDFEMVIKGERKNIDLFLDALQQKGNVYIGRGVRPDVIDFYDDEELPYAVLMGFCKWSIGSCLINNAISMREEPKIWAFDTEDESGNVIFKHADEIGVEFVTLEEACEKFNVTVEIFSSEPGCCFAEHYIVTPNGTEVSEEREYHEYPIGECKRNNMSREDAEKEFGITISIKDWEAPGEYLLVGGFKAEYSI